MRGHAAHLHTNNMRAIARALLFLAGSFNSAGAQWEIRPAESARMELTVSKTGLLSGKKHLFRFADYKGTLEFNEEVPEKSSITISIRSGSVSCRDTWLTDKDL